MVDTMRDPVRTLVSRYRRDDLQTYSFGHDKLTSDEARRIAAIGRLPEFLEQRRGFYPRDGGHPRWHPSRPYHVALEDEYIRSHWGHIDALCKLNGIPFKPTRERIQNESLWCVHEFTWQLDAMQFWDRFEGRWMRGAEFHYPERPKDLPVMKEIAGWPKFDPRKLRE